METLSFTPESASRERCAPGTAMGSKGLSRSCFLSKANRRRGCWARHTEDKDKRPEGQTALLSQRKARLPGLAFHPPALGHGVLKAHLKCLKEFLLGEAEPIFMSEKKDILGAGEATSVCHSCRLTELDPCDIWFS